MNTLATITFHGFIQFFSFLEWEIFVCFYMQWTTIIYLGVIFVVWGPKTGSLIQFILNVNMFIAIILYLLVW